MAENDNLKDTHTQTPKTNDSLWHATVLRDSGTGKRRENFQSREPEDRLRTPLSHSRPPRRRSHPPRQKHSPPCTE